MIFDSVVCCILQNMLLCHLQPLQPQKSKRYQSSKLICIYNHYHCLNNHPVKPQALTSGWLEISTGSNQTIIVVDSNQSKKYDYILVLIIRISNYYTFLRLQYGST